MATIANSTFRTRLALGGALFVAWCGLAHSQAYTPPPPDLKTGPCVVTRTEPCNQPAAKPPAIPAAADKFPFPGESPGSAAPGNNAASPQEDKGSEPAKKPANDSRFAFPGETPDTVPPSSTSSSSSSSSSPEQPSSPNDDAPTPENKPALKDAGSTGSTRFARRKIVAPEDLDHRELEDLDVSKYYMSTGNYVAAYKRATDALKLYPDDENAHIAVAVAAEKLDKKVEATAEYHAYLAAAPDGDKAKLARHALELLEPGPAPHK